MQRLTILLVALLLALLPGRGASAQLELELCSEQEEYPVAGPVSLKLALRNDGPDYRLLYPDFRARDCSASPSHQVQLHFLVTGPDGETVQRTGSCQMIKERLPGLDEIMIFGPTFFFGRTFDLTRGELAYGFERPGLYRIQAIATITVRDWVLQQVERQGMKSESLPFDPSKVASVVLESQEVLVEIVDRSVED